jgi:predicted ribosome quality control (RQC) complex YloA/Tae2 family protein
MKEEHITDNKSNIEFTYWIGESAQDNWDIIDKADPNDIWFHLADHPSAHVILRMPEKMTLKKMSKQTLIHCAVQCKLHSKFSNISTKNKMKVIYTEIKNVSKADKPGAVYTKKENDVKV